MRADSEGAGAKNINQQTSDDFLSINWRGKNNLEGGIG